MVVMDQTGPSLPGQPSPGDLVVHPKNEAIQAAAQPTGDGGLLSQLTSNPFFTAVRRLEGREEGRQDAD
jgi:chaperone BCS1